MHRSSLLDHLIRRGQQRFRDGEAESFGGLEIDDQFQLGRLLNWQISRFFAFENAPGIDANFVVRIAYAAAIAHQTAGQGVLTVWEDRGQRMAGGQRREVFNVPVVKC